MSWQTKIWELDKIDEVLVKYGFKKMTRVVTDQLSPDVANKYIYESIGCGFDEKFMRNEDLLGHFMAAKRLEEFIRKMLCYDTKS